MSEISYIEITAAVFITFLTHEAQSYAHEITGLLDLLLNPRLRALEQQAIAIPEASEMTPSLRSTYAHVIAETPAMAQEPSALTAAESIQSPEDTRHLIQQEEIIQKASAETSEIEESQNTFNP